MSARCLHCGAQLAVLRKLTGGGEFCSEAHRSTYQDELNKVALGRLKKARPRQEQSAGITEVGRGSQIAEAILPPQLDAPPLATFLSLPNERQARSLTGPAGLLSTPEFVGFDLRCTLPSSGVAALVPRVPRAAERAECAPVPYPDRDLDLGGLLETLLSTTGLELSGDESSEKVEPALPLAALAPAVAESPAAVPQATKLRRIAVIAFSPAPPVVVHSSLPIPPALQCRTPEVRLMLFRAAPPSLATVAPAMRPAPPVAPEYTATNFTLGMPNQDMGSPISRFWNVIPSKAKMAVFACLVAAIVAYVVSKETGKSSDSLASGLAATAPVSGFVGGGIPAGGGGWATEWAGDPLGLKRGTQLTLYTPSMQLKDYRTEFVGQIAATSLGWVFRVKDHKNYYAMKVRVVRPGVEPEISLTRYAVVNGVEGPRADIPLDFPARNDTLYKIQLEVRGPKFTTSIQGRAVDIWSDDRLTSGGFGFSNERGERAHIKSVSVSF